MHMHTHICTHTHIGNRNMNQPGTVPAWFFDKHQFTPDVDADGKIVRRDFDLGLEWRWRNCILTNPHLVLQRRQWKHDKVMAGNKKMTDSLASKNDILKKSREIIAAREALLQKPLHEWSFEEFFRLKVEDIKCFMKARTPGVVMPTKGPINKGSVDADPEANTLARIAFRMRDKPPVAETLTLDDLGLALADSEQTRTLVKLPGLVDAGQFVGPLDHLSRVTDDVVYCNDDVWMARVESLLTGYTMQHVRDHPAIDIAVDVSRIRSILVTRLQQHLRQRLVGSITSLRSHWCWQFYSQNIPRLATIVVWFGHTLAGVRIEYAHKSGLPLLYTGMSFSDRFLPVDHVLPATICGAYIHRDVELGNVWIRSGKVARAGGHAARQREHARAASKPIDDKTASFYRAYNTNGGSRGDFRSLRCHFAMGFNKSQIKEVASLFAWTVDTKRRCRTRSWQTFDEAAVHCISYAFELTYDLLLHPNSVSTGPGYEGFLGPKYLDHIKSQHK